MDVHEDVANRLQIIFRACLYINKGLLRPRWAALEQYLLFIGGASSPLFLMGKTLTKNRSFLVGYGSKTMLSRSSSLCT